MKRFFCFLFVLVLLPLVSFADPGVVLCYRMNFYAASYNDDHPGYFDYDSMIIDVYLMDDFQTAYYSKNTWKNGSIESTGFVKCSILKTENGRHPLSFPNGEMMYFYYDEDGRFWLEMENGTYHLLECERFNVQEDLKR